MRIVLDTNILISAALKKESTPAMAVYLAERHCVFLKSAATEQELFLVMARPQMARLISPRFVEWAHALFAKAELIKITQHITACRDAKDNKFLDVAINGCADMIVTGDQDLLVLNPFQGIAIVPPAVFIHRQEK